LRLTLDQIAPPKSGHLVSIFFGNLGADWNLKFAKQCGLTLSTNKKRRASGSYFKSTESPAAARAIDGTLSALGH
jgi:hypothetical protein